MLLISGQKAQHDTVTVRGSQECLQELRDVLERSLLEKFASATVRVGDPDCIVIKVLLDDSHQRSETWRRAQLPYSHPEALSEQCRAAHDLHPQTHADVLNQPAQNKQLTQSPDVLSRLRVWLNRVSRGQHAFLNVHLGECTSSVIWFVANKRGMQEAISALTRAIGHGRAIGLLEASDREGYDLKVLRM